MITAQYIRGENLELINWPLSSITGRRKNNKTK